MNAVLEALLNTQEVKTMLEERAKTMLEERLHALSVEFGEREKNLCARLEEEKEASRRRAEEQDKKDAAMQAYLQEKRIEIERLQARIESQEQEVRHLRETQNAREEATRALEEKVRAHEQEMTDMMAIETLFTGEVSACLGCKTLEDRIQAAKTLYERGVEQYKAEEEKMMEKMRELMGQLGFYVGENERLRARVSKCDEFRNWMKNAPSVDLTNE